MSNDTNCAQGPYVVVVREHVQIALPNGIVLEARIWMPKCETPIPALLEYLPYRKEDLTRKRDALTHPYFASHGYASIRVDMRGSGNATGLLLDEYLHDEQDDALEVLKWLASQSWCNGSVGIFGISWGGFNALQIAARQPQQLKAIISLASTDDRYADDIHYMGGVLINHNLTWSSTMFSFNSTPPDLGSCKAEWRKALSERLSANEPWLLKWMRHPARDGYWKHGSICEDYSSVKAPALLIGGWADGYSNSVPRMLENLECPRIGIVGPWGHKYPHFAEPAPRIGFLQEALRWWDHWLKEIPNGVEDTPMYRVFNQHHANPQAHYCSRPGLWVSERQWPSVNIVKQRYYLCPDGLHSHCADRATTCNVHSPLSLGVHQGEWYGSGVLPDCPTEQRHEDADSVVFDTATLNDAVNVLGAPVLRLRFASDQENAFLCVRMLDVDEHNSSTRVSYGLKNLSMYESLDQPAPLTKGKWYDCSIQLNDLAHIFPRGHRLRIAVSNSNWPMCWPSPVTPTISLDLSACCIDLPIRPYSQDGDSDGAVVMPPPFTMPAEPCEETRPGSYERRITRDECSRKTTLDILCDSGESKFTETGRGMRTVTTQQYDIVDEEPCSARATVTWKFCINDPQYSFESITVTTMTSDTKDFHVSASIECSVDGDHFFSKTWDESVARMYN